MPIVTVRVRGRLLPSVNVNGAWIVSVMPSASASKVPFGAVKDQVAFFTAPGSAGSVASKAKRPRMSAGLKAATAAGSPDSVTPARAMVTVSERSASVTVKAPSAKSGPSSESAVWPGEAR